MPYGPTPDLDRKTVAWAGVNTDGTPCTGRIVLQYTGPVMLDDSDETPVSVYPTRLVMQLGQRTLLLNQNDGTAQAQIVGYAEAQVPASNDPDILGSGGAYTVIEDLDEGNGLTKTVVIDKDAAGTIWLNRLTHTDIPPGEAPSYVSVADFDAIRRASGLVEARVNLLAYTAESLAASVSSLQYLPTTVAALSATSSSVSAALADIVNDVADIEDGPDLVLLYENAKV